jgi:hypothetical protein
MNKMISIILMLITLVGCITPNNPEISPDHSIISLKEKYSALQEVAQKWDTEAYLRSVEVPIFARPEDNYLWLVNATFQSPNKTLETLAVKIETDGHITFSPISRKTEVYQTTPIDLDDWQVDSQEALVYFQELDMPSLTIPNGQTSLFLERVLSETGQTLVWRLSTNMESTNGQHYYIDATDGTLLQISR